MPNNLKNHLINLKVIDFEANLSYHKPLTFVLSVINLNGPSEEVASAATDRLKPAALFRGTNMKSLITTVLRVELPVCNYTGPGVCPNTEHCSAINKLYDDFVKSLHEAEHLSVPRIPLKSLKPFWSAELDKFKAKAILWQNI